MLLDLPVALAQAAARPGPLRGPGAALRPGGPGRRPAARFRQPRGGRLGHPRLPGRRHDRRPLGALARRPPGQRCRRHPPDPHARPERATEARRCCWLCSAPKGRRSTSSCCSSWCWRGRRSWRGRGSPGSSACSSAAGRSDRTAWASSRQGNQTVPQLGQFGLLYLMFVAGLGARPRRAQRLPPLGGRLQPAHVHAARSSAGWSSASSSASRPRPPSCSARCSPPTRSSPTR